MTFRSGRLGIVGFALARRSLLVLASLPSLEVLQPYRSYPVNYARIHCTRSYSQIAK